MTERVTERTTRHPDRLRSRPAPARRAAGLLALGAVGIAALGLLAWRQMAADDAAVLASLYATSASAPAPVHGPVTPATAAAAPARPQAPSALDALPLQAQIERLVATGDPQDAYRAYHLVANCAAFNANGDRMIFDQEEIKHWKGDSLPGFRGMTEDEKRHDARLCAGMTERERQNRLDYLALAARAGVAGAAEDFMTEGPFGDRSALTTRPDDVLVKQWKDTARAQMTRAAESGTDLGALLVWQATCASGSDVVDRDPALAYRYSLAVGMVEADLFGRDALEAKLYAQGSSMMTKLAAELTPEQQAAELAAAKAIAARARAARKAGRGG